MFEVAATYTKDQIYARAGVPEARQGGQWATGYAEFEGAFFIFCNIGAAGRTGHDYANAWRDGLLLEWSAKNGTSVTGAQIKRLLSPAATAHIFWREHDRAPWTYAGLGEPVEVIDETPVRVTWALAPPEKGQDAAALELARPGYAEGQKRLRIHYATERHPGLVRDFKEQLADWTCALCDFDFAETYGSVGWRYIEAHHVDPLAGAGETVNTIDDLLAVCANCHRMLHRGWPRLTPDQLRERIKKAG
ncbi:MAG TPA: HNH endonuclease [Phenylobacterium sp.]|nr:HNH endonuclease [Phenylobacterium sp.]